MEQQTLIDGSYEEDGISILIDFTASTKSGEVSSRGFQSGSLRNIKNEVNGLKVNMGIMTVSRDNIREIFAFH